MKLYYMPGACSLATHILLREAGQTFDLERVGRDKATETGANFLDINPKGYVPALKMNDGDLLTENVVLHGYVASLNPAAKLAPAPGSKERLKVDELAVYVSTEIHKGYSPLFNPMLPDAVKAGYRDKLAQRYALIEQLLSDGRPYLTGESFTTADAYLFVCSTWASMTGVDLSKFTKVMAFVARVSARPAVIAAMEAEGLLKAA